MKNKKWFLALAALLVVTTLTTGCGQKAELKDGSQVAVKLDGIKITADEYYNEIKGINIATLVDMIDHQLFDKKYGKTDEENDQVEEQIKSLKDQYGSNEDTYNAVLRLIPLTYLYYLGSQHYHFHILVLGEYESVLLLDLGNYFQQELILHNLIFLLIMDIDYLL